MIPVRMTAAQILEAIRRKHPRAALVPELTVNVPMWDESEAQKYQRRIDALMIQSHERTAIEIKTTPADFKRETDQKVRPWRNITHRFIYAFPAGMEGMPGHGLGLWWVHTDGTIEVRKKAIVRKYPEPLPQDVIQRLAYRAGGMPPTPWEDTPLPIDFKENAA